MPQNGFDMIIVKERPYDKCMTGNPIAYELYSALAAANQDIYFEVRIMFAYAHTLFYAELVRFPAYPTNGTAKINIQDFLDGKLDFDLPAFNADERDATVSPNQTGLFYIEFREILTGGSDNPAWDSSEDDYKKFVMKGGLSYFKYRGDNFWENYFDDNNPFLTWQKSGRLARKQDRQYLAFLNTTQLPSWEIPEVVGPSLWASAKAYYTDGTESDRIYHAVTPANNYQHGINFIPAGCDQWGLQTLEPGKKIWKWDIQMYYTSESDGTRAALNEPYIFEADNRNNYENYLLQFRNSLGGLDAILLRGVIEPHQNYTYEEQARTFLNDYFSGEYISPARVIANAKEKTIWKADAGWLPKEDQDRIRDMNLNRNAWWDVGDNDKWWPVNILSPSFKQRTSEDTKWQFPVEFSLAYEGDKYYTPNAVILGDRVFASNVCAAEITNIDIAVDTSGPTATITVDFSYPVGLVNYTYQIIGVHADPVLANTADLPLVIGGLAKETSFVIKLRPKCSNDVLGRIFNASFNTIGAGGGGSGGGGGGGAFAGEITNDSAVDENVLIMVDGDTVFDGFIPGSTTDNFTIDNYANVTAVITLEHTATGALISGDGGTYHGVVSGNTITFTNITITNGCVITYF